MENRLKERLTGAAILVALVVMLTEAVLGFTMIQPAGMETAGCVA